MSRLRPTYLLLTVAVAAALTSCGGVPRSSSPAVVRPVPLGAPPQPPIHPVPHESARDIVINFLRANNNAANAHSSARQFLTPAAANRWSDSTATIVEDETIGTYRPGKPDVVVTGREVGTLDSNGIFTPSHLGTGNGGQRVPFRFGIKKVHGEYRIDTPIKGLLLTLGEFQAAYQQRALYFFDLSNRYLVPDLRWSALSGPALAQWLVTQLAAGPSSQVGSAVSGESIPQQSAPQQGFIRAGNPMKIEITGSSQLDPGARDRLAAQIGVTLNDAMPGQVFQITDGGVPIRIPAAGASDFSDSSFTRDLGPSAPAPLVFYLRRGRIFDSRGDALPGPINDGRYGRLSSVAVLRPLRTSQFDFSAVAGGRLLVGNQAGGFVPTSVRGNLTRPAFAPGRDEAWVGDGRRLYRVLGSIAVPAHRPKVYSVPITSLTLRAGQHIVAIRFSPEGSRVALIIGSPGGTNQLYVGAVVRNSGQVSIDVPNPPISPNHVSVDDVAWLEPLRLIAVGNLANRDEPRIFNTYVDGSFWTNIGISNLPNQPDSVTVLTGHLPWVTVNGTVWYQSIGKDWASPSPSGETFGYAAVYME